jgi:uncharacterized protein (TIGR04255 family)
LQIDPPIVELALSVGFQPLAGLSVVDVAELYTDNFKRDYPTVQQTQPLPPMQIGPAGTIFQIQMGIEIPRLWFISPDTHFVAQIQSDRVAQNWRRIGPLTERLEYPGFESVKSRLVDSYKRLTQWLNARGMPPPPLTVAEIAYVNHVPLMEAGRPVRLSEVAAWYNASENAVSITGLNAAWWEEAANLEGFVNVQFLTTALPDGTPALSANLTGRFAVTDMPLEGALARFDLMHEKIHEIFGRVLTPKYAERAVR